MKDSKTGEPIRYVSDVRYDVMGLGHDAYRDLMKVLGQCVPQLVGWCELDHIHGGCGVPRPALVVTQAWPFLPFGTDPRPIIKARKYAALIPSGMGFLVVEVPVPPQLVEAERMQRELDKKEPSE